MTPSFATGNQTHLRSQIDLICARKPTSHVAHVRVYHVAHVTITHVAHVTDSCPAIIAIQRRGYASPSATELRSVFSVSITLRSACKLDRGVQLECYRPAKGGPL